jgi:hypothetical protein
MAAASIHSVLGKFLTDMVNARIRMSLLDLSNLERNGKVYKVTKHQNTKTIPKKNIKNVNMPVPE